MTIRVAHDFTCPWCWVGLFQARRLQAEYGVEIDWVGYELQPEELEWPEPTIKIPDPPNKPKILSRFEFLLFNEGMELPVVSKPVRMRTHRAHLAVEIAKPHGVADTFVEALYRAFWEEGREINDIDVLLELADGRLPAEADLRAAIEAEEGAEKITHFDKPAYASGVYNVPTFFIGNVRLAEMPYGLIRAAMERMLTGSNN